MEKQKRNMLLVTLAALFTMTLTIVFASNTESFGAFAYNHINEYGCAGNCKGEYEIRHVKQILQDDPSKNGSPNVRFNIKVSKYSYQFGMQFFQDVNDYTEFNTTESVTYQAIHDQLAVITGIQNGMTNYTQGDIISVAGTVYWTQVYGIYTLEIQNAVVYAKNGVVDFSLIPPVNYIS